MSDQITILTYCDGFGIRLDELGIDVHIDQEDDQSEGLREVFEKLGYNVVVEGCY